ncbi:succinyldiaminopimelate transaminase [Endothiovibrio diazotrophicus]
MPSYNNAPAPERNPRLQVLQPYPFEKLKALFADLQTPPGRALIDLSVGEPRHAPPASVADLLAEGGAEVATYPTTAGTLTLRQAIADWLQWRFELAPVDPLSQVLPTLGSREALFAFAQAVIDGSRSSDLVVCQNPFYQIYEGAALLAGVQPYFVNALEDGQFRSDWQSVPPAVWQRTQLVFVCSPANPTGAVTTLAEWQTLFALADRYDFIIAADECYSDIYIDERTPPLGALQAAQLSGRADFSRLVVFGSLSKRSNVPGLRSGFAAGDAGLIAQFLRYRTYHGSAMSGLVQRISQSLWGDRTHVADNRARYAAKFSAFSEQLNPLLPVCLPDAGFYCWLQTPVDDRDFARGLYREQGVVVLPGSFLAREVHGINPGRNRIRVALVGSESEVREAAQRFVAYVGGLPSGNMHSAEVTH